MRQKRLETISVQLQFNLESDSIEPRQLTQL